MANPLADDQAELRTSLLPGMLKVVQHNLNRDIQNVQVFEIGRVFFSKGEDQPSEVEMIGCALTGNWIEKSWYGEYPEIDFFDAKGIIESAFKQFGIRNYQYIKKQSPSFHPGRTSEINFGVDKGGLIGEIHPKVLETYQIDQKVIYFEIDLSVLVENLSAIKSYQSVPIYPGISIDIAIVVDDKYTVGDVIQTINESKIELLKSIRLFDIYTGTQIPPGKKSMAFRLQFQSEERTLTEEEVIEVRGDIIKILDNKIGAQLRA